MSSYHSKFTYLNKDSKKDLGWIIVAFDPDNGESDSYLSQEQIYTESHNGSKRILYGTKWDDVAKPKITVIKQDGTSFSLAECRSAYRWLTGNPNATWLDLYADNELQYSFLCTVQDVKPQKLDARTVGMNIYFESISPWAYSPTMFVHRNIDQGATVDKDGILSVTDTSVVLSVDDNGVLYNAQTNDGKIDISDNGSIDFNGVTTTLTINNETDDLYSYVYLEVSIVNIAGDCISIKNKTLNEETLITDLTNGEVIAIYTNHVISSSKLNKIFGNTFNFVWPRLAPGINKFEIDCSGSCSISFAYRYPIKVGDCAMDVDVHGSELDVC